MMKIHKFFSTKKWIVIFSTVILLILIFFIFLSVSEKTIINQLENKNPAIIKSSIYTNNSNYTNLSDLIINHNTNIILNSHGELVNSEYYLFSHDDLIQIGNLSLIAKISYLSIDIWSEITELPFKSNNYLFYNFDEINFTSSGINLNREGRDISIQNYDILYKKPRIDNKGETYTNNNFGQISKVYIYAPIKDLTINTFKLINIKSSLYSSTFSIFYEFYLQKEVINNINSLKDISYLFQKFKSEVDKQIIIDFPTSENYIESPLISIIYELEQVFISNNANILLIWFLVILVFEIGVLIMLNDIIVNFKQLFLLLQSRGFEHMDLVKLLWYNAVIIPISSSLLFLVAGYFLLTTRLFLLFMVQSIYWLILYLLVGTLQIVYNTRKFKISKNLNLRNNSIFKKIIIIISIYYFYKISTITKIGHYTIILHPQYLGRLTPDTGIIVEFIFFIFILLISRITFSKMEKLARASIVFKLSFIQLQKRRYFILFIAFIIFINSFFVTSVFSEYYQNDYIFGENEMYADFVISIDSPSTNINMSSILQIDNIQDILRVDRINVLLSDPKTNLQNSIYVVNQSKYLEYLSLFNVTRDYNYLKSGIWTNKLLYQHLKNNKDPLNIIIGNNSAYVSKNDIFSLKIQSGIIPPLFVEQSEKIILSRNYFNILFDQINLRLMNFKFTYLFLKMTNLVDKEILSSRISNILKTKVDIISNDKNDSNIQEQINPINYIFILNLFLGFIIGFYVWMSYNSDNSFKEEMRRLSNYGVSDTINKVFRFNNLFFILLYIIVYQSTVIFTIYRSQGIQLFIYNNYFIPDMLNLEIQLIFGFVPLISFILSQYISKLLILDQLNKC